MRSENTLAADDPGRDPTKEIEKRLQKAEIDLSRLRARLGKESSTDDQRAATVQKTLDQAQVSFERIGKTAQSISAAREQAHQELGQLLQKAIVQRLQTLQENLEVRGLAVERAEQELYAFSAGVSEGLLEWPDLLDQVKSQLPYRDRSTAILEAQLHLIKCTLSVGLGANIESADVFRRAGLPWGDMPGLLSFDPANFYPAFNGSNSPTVLLERKRDIEKLLEVYRAEKKGVASPVVGSGGAKRPRW